MNFERKSLGGEKWVFPIDVKEKIDVEFVENQERMSKDGKVKIPVCIFMGKLEGYTGDLVVSHWKADLSESIKAYGFEESNWKGKIFQLETINERIKITPVI